MPAGGFDTFSCWTEGLLRLQARGAASLGELSDSAAGRKGRLRLPVGLTHCPCGALLPASSGGQ